RLRCCCPSLDMIRRRRRRMLIDRALTAISVATNAPTHTLDTVVSKEIVDLFCLCHVSLLTRPSLYTLRRHSNSVTCFCIASIANDVEGGSKSNFTLTYM